MIRPLVLCLCAVLLAAAEYDPKPDQVALYQWNTTQSAQWTSAGDDLRYSTTITWDLALRCAALNGSRMTLAATFVKVVATHKGPGTDIRIDSTSGAGADDALLGHLMALVGKTLTLEVERATGQVVSVGGGEEIIAAINRAAPAAVPGDPPPLDLQAKAAYGAEALARLWSQILALPGADAQVALPAPFTAGAFTRTWKDDAWSAALSAGPAASFELSPEPVPVRGTVTKLSGSGSIALKDGLPEKASGSLAFSLAISAMTQPVTTENTVTWELRAQ